MFIFVCLYIFMLCTFIVIPSQHITQIISGAVPGKYLQANMDSLVKVILFVIAAMSYNMDHFTNWWFSYVLFCDREFRSLMRVMTPSKKNLIILSILLLADHFAPQIRSDKSKQLLIYQDKNIFIYLFIYLFHCTEDLTLSLINF